MVNFKLKYLKYKMKYEKLSSKKFINQKGGTIVLKVAPVGAVYDLEDFFNNTYPTCLNDFLNDKATKNHHLLPVKNGREPFGQTVFNWGFDIGFGHPADTYNPGEVAWLDQFRASYNNIHVFIVNKLRDLLRGNDPLKKDLIYDKIVTHCPVHIDQLRLDTAPIYCEFSPWGISAINYIRRHGHLYLEPLRLRKGSGDTYHSINTTSFLQNQYTTFIKDLLYIREKLYNLQIYEYIGTETIILQAADYDFYLRPGNIVYYNEAQGELSFDDNVFEIDKSLFTKIQNRCDWFVNDLCNDITNTLLELRSDIIDFRDTSNNLRQKGSYKVAQYGKAVETEITNNIIPIINNGFIENGHNVLGLNSYAFPPTSNRYQLLIDQLNHHKENLIQLEDENLNQTPDERLDMISSNKKEIKIAQFNAFNGRLQLAWKDFNTNYEAMYEFYSNLDNTNFKKTIEKEVRAWGLIHIQLNQEIEGVVGRKEVDDALIRALAENQHILVEMHDNWIKKEKQLKREENNTGNNTLEEIDEKLKKNFNDYKKKFGLRPAASPLGATKNRERVIKEIREGEDKKKNKKRLQLFSIKDPNRPKEVDKDHWVPAEHKGIYYIIDVQNMNLTPEDKNSSYLLYNPDTDKSLQYEYFDLQEAVSENKVKTGVGLGGVAGDGLNTAPLMLLFGGDED